MPNLAEQGLVQDGAPLRIASVCLSLPCTEESALLQLLVRQWGLAIYIGSILNTTQSHRVTENSQTINRNAHCRLDFAERNGEFPHK